METPTVTSMHHT